MKKIVNPLLALLLTALFSTSAFSQKDRPSMKFGDVKVSDFSPQVYSLDSSAGAIYLFDEAASNYQGNSHSSFDVVYTVHIKMRLLKKSAFDDAATIKIPVEKTDHLEEKLEDLQAATYNLENGQVVVTKLDKASIFKDKDGDYIVTKFTFPNIKEGSIIEYSYKHSRPSPYRIRPWFFQGQYPSLWSEYNVEIPEFYDFAFFKQGYLPFYIDTFKISHDNFTVLVDENTANSSSQSLHITANTVQHTWVIKDVKPLKEESFTTTLENHVSKIEFQLSSIRFPNEPIEPYMQDWHKVTGDLMKDEDFGEALNHENGWLKDDIKKAVEDDKDVLEAVKKIFAYVRDNYNCTDYTAIYLSQTLKKTQQLKKGNVVDINMLLAAMLHNIGIEVHPVMLSTRRNGKAIDYYPILSKFNYVITQCIVDGKSYLLDAADGDVAFGKLPGRCYNGNARTISADYPVLINLSADSLKETRITSLFLVNEDKGLSGSYTSTYGNAGSIDIRDELKTSDKQKEYFAAVKKNFSFDVDMSDATIDSLKSLDDPVAIKYNFKFNADDDIIYFNPLLSETLKENPFKSAERIYPVERPYCIDEVYVLNMEIPKGYKIEEKPKSARVMLNENDGMFEYIIAASDTNIQLRCRINIKKANFDPEDYQTLREFYGFIVKKEAEQIVFKKI